MKLVKYLFLLYLVLRVLAACDHQTRPASKEPMRRPVVYASGNSIVAAALGYLPSILEVVPHPNACQQCAGCGRANSA